MVKVISMSVWGDNPSYSIGAIKMQKLQKNYFQIGFVEFLLMDQFQPIMLKKC